MSRLQTWLKRGNGNLLVLGAIVVVLLACASWVGNAPSQSAQPVGKQNNVVSAEETLLRQLKVLFQKSDLVVVGEVVSEPHGIVKEDGVVHYPCDFRVAETLKGSSPNDATMKVSIVLEERRIKDQNGKGKVDRPFELTKGTKAILFLENRPQNVPQSIDIRIGTQLATPSMVAAVKQFVKE